MSMMLMSESFKKQVGNPARKLVLVKLADNANDQGECWPSYGHIARECEMGRSTVKAHIKALEEAGFLKIKHRRTGDMNQSNVYQLTLSQGKPIERAKPNRPGKAKMAHVIDPGQPLTYHPGQPLTHLGQPLTPPRSAVDRGVGQPLTPEPVTKNQSLNQSRNPICATALREGFEIFYEAGLVKKSRKRAEAAFKTQSRKHPDPVAFGKMLAENIKGRLGTGEMGFDAMHPTTYLNQQRWLDEVAPAGEQACPHDELIDLWSELMPEFRQHAKNLWPGSQRQRDLENRWRAGFLILNENTGEPLYHDTASGVAWWSRFFKFLRRSEFLMREGQQWLSLEWVADREHFDAILELKYHADLLQGEGGDS